MPHTKRVMPELSSGAMADIAFLLLTFYMVTTEIKDNKGLAMLLPPFQEAQQKTVNDRNLFAIHINSANRVMVEGKEILSVAGLRDELKAFILNYGQNPKASDSPEVAVVSIKTDRGTSHRTFVLVLDEAQAAYFAIYGERVGMSARAFRELDLNLPANKRIYEKARTGIPMNISIAEPNSTQF